MTTAAPDFVRSLSSCIEAPAPAALAELRERCMADEAGLAGRLVVLLSQPVHWQIRLCVFKYIAYCSTSHEARSALWHIARDDICASNIFVRAWAYNMLAWTAEGLPSHAEEARELLAMGARDEPPAVRARIRAALRRRYVP